MSLIPLWSVFFGALVAQYLSHWFTKRREKRNFRKEIFGELILPYLNNILLYVTSNTTPVSGGGSEPLEKDKEEDRSVDIKDIVKGISENIKYGDSKLINALLQFDKSITFFDGKGNQKDTKQLELLYWFVNYAATILKKIDKSETGLSLLEEIQQVQKRLGI
ncbi:hypothetical protein [Priestia filamentosa]|uniref:hypothetical protein n=1 Tax=Priestia filamentosa TaxID=1402861 RepID=UPI002E249027|nr:hypothetical protein [Priestia filamentosa]